LNKEELIGARDAMKEIALAYHLQKVNAEVLRYNKEKEEIRKWYDTEKAKL
jgi:hypothetical protein